MNCLVSISIGNFTALTIGIVCGNFRTKSMALAKKVVLTMENFEEHSIQEQVSRMMAMVEMSSQQAVAVNRELKDTRTELTTKIAKLHRKISS